MEPAKHCQQCGELRPQSQYRQYYGGRKGYYRTCKICEQVNNRHKYLSKLERPHSPAETEELRKINQLYELQRSRGLKPPGSGPDTPVDIDALIAQQQAEIARVPEDVPTDTPSDLLQWLTKDLDEYAGTELEDIIDDLTARYRPQIGLEDLQPVYDNKYRDVLQQIIRRLEDHIDNM